MRKKIRNERAICLEEVIKNNRVFMAPSPAITGLWNTTGGRAEEKKLQCKFSLSIHGWLVYSVEYSVPESTVIAIQHTQACTPTHTNTNTNHTAAKQITKDKLAAHTVNVPKPPHELSNTHPIYIIHMHSQLLLVTQSHILMSHAVDHSLLTSSIHCVTRQHLWGLPVSQGSLSSHRGSLWD